MHSRRDPEEFVTAIELATGKIAWHGTTRAAGGNCGACRFLTHGTRNIVTPVWTGKHLVVSGPRQGTPAYSLTVSNGAWTAAAAWKNAGVTMYMSSPVHADGTMFALSNKRKASSW